MKPETRTVTQLFGLDVRYVVPLYQRPYVRERSGEGAPKRRRTPRRTDAKIKEQEP